MHLFSLHQIRTETGMRAGLGSEGVDVWAATIGCAGDPQVGMTWNTHATPLQLSTSSLCREQASSRPKKDPVCLCCFQNKSCPPDPFCFNTPCGRRIWPSRRIGATVGWGSALLRGFHDRCASVTAAVGEGFFVAEPFSPTRHACHAHSRAQRGICARGGRGLQRVPSDARNHIGRQSSMRCPPGLEEGPLIIMG
jgi:hypothetical protein